MRKIFLIFLLLLTTISIAGPRGYGVGKISSISAHKIGAGYPNITRVIGPVSGAAQTAQEPAWAWNFDSAAYVDLGVGFNAYIIDSVSGVQKMQAISETAKVATGTDAYGAYVTNPEIADNLRCTFSNWSNDWSVGTFFCVVQVPAATGFRFFCGFEDGKGATYINSDLFEMGYYSSSYKMGWGGKSSNVTYAGDSPWTADKPMVVAIVYASGYSQVRVDGAIKSNMVDANFQGLASGPGKLPFAFEFKSYSDSNAINQKIYRYSFIPSVATATVEAAEAWLKTRYNL